jgi:hypothetical protein
MIRNIDGRVEEKNGFHADRLHESVMALKKIGLA